MSDDIAKYLRLSQNRFNRHAEAADEIERLREEVARLTLLSNLWESEFVAAVDALKDKEVRGD